MYQSESKIATPKGSYLASKKHTSKGATLDMPYLVNKRQTCHQNQGVQNHLTADTESANQDIESETDGLPESLRNGEHSNTKKEQDLDDVDFIEDRYR